ncbi:MAG: hypothetical protein WD096_02560 [Actinomycetota bacterium]
MAKCDDCGQDFILEDEGTLMPRGGFTLGYHLGKCPAGHYSLDLESDEPIPPVKFTVAAQEPFSDGHWVRLAD